ncbi:hypothetical protein Tco_0878872 [Tanacetum coccineum]|uniref:Integrase, catalytic region, zinc finger, CCHC-type, peptidase aspartic, catalytic n=1 Tax=Tanacetum coccineum TaxID=301880 RepID=A0ABQ5BZ50_9ASTR
MCVPIPTTCCMADFLLHGLQRIGLYCGVRLWDKHLKSIDEGHIDGATARNSLMKERMRPINLGPEDLCLFGVVTRGGRTTYGNVKMLWEGTETNKGDRESQLYDDLNTSFVTAVKLNKGLKDSNFDQLYAYLKQHEAHANAVSGRQNRGQGNSARGAGAVGYGRAQNRVGNANPGQARQNSEYFKDKMLLMQAQENGVILDEEQSLFLAGGLDNAIDEDVDEQPVQDLALNVDNVFQADDCDAYDSDVDDAPTAQTLFMANLSSADLVYDEAGPSYDSDVLSEVQNHDHYQDAVCDLHDEHEMHDDVQPNHVVDSHADYTSDSNMTPYDQYVKDNAVPVVQNNASMVPNDAYGMIDNDLHESDVPSVSHTPRNTVVNNLLNAELATYKEQVELYERRARFELTEREQKIDEQLRIVICDRNIKEENLKKELHSVKLQLASTIQHNKLMVDEVTSLKKDFNQKENKYLEEFLDLKTLKDKVEDKLFKQGQSCNTPKMGRSGIWVGECYFIDQQHEI